MTRMDMITDLLNDKGSMFRNCLISLINRWRCEENGTQLVDEVMKSDAVIVDKHGRISLPRATSESLCNFQKHWKHL